MSQSYFITGGLGCIGAWVAAQLVDRGESPVIFDKDSKTHRLRSLMSGSRLQAVSFVGGDVNDFNAVSTAMKESRARRVIHLAGLQMIPCQQQPSSAAKTNILGTLNVFEAAHDLGIEQVVYASSAAVYGKSILDKPVDETTPLEASSHYAVFKIANEGNARVFFLENGLCSVGLRPLTIYGVGRDSGLTSDLTKAMISALFDQPFHIRFQGRTDFQYVADVAAAFIASADSASRGARIFNIQGETLPIGQIVRMIDDCLPSKHRGLITYGGPELPLPATIDGNRLRARFPELRTTPAAEAINATILRFISLKQQGLISPEWFKP